MTHAQVDRMLREYRLLVGRCGHIDAEISRCRRAIEREKEQFVADAAAPAVSLLTGMPRGTTPGNPTEKTALMLAEGAAFERSDARAEICRLEAQIDALRREREEKALRVQYVESWLNGLADRERWVIERHVIEREIWHDIIPQFNTRYTDDVSKDRLKRLQQRAMQKIYDMAV